MRKKMKVHFSSASNEWATPQDLFDRINKKWGPFDLDPCCTDGNRKCNTWMTVRGLEQSWAVKGPRTRVFMNPPYGREIGKWVKKAYEEAQKGCIVVCLIPSRTETIWWHEYCWQASKIVFFKGRIRFEQNGKKDVAPFPSCLVIFAQKSIDSMPWIDTMDAHE